MENIKTLLVDRAELRAALERLVLARTYADYAKIAAVEESILDLVCGKLDLSPYERPGARELIKLCQGVMRDKFKEPSDYRNPIAVLDFLGVWIDGYPKSVLDRILDLAAPLDVSPTLTDGLD